MADGRFLSFSLERIGGECCVDSVDELIATESSDVTLAVLLEWTVVVSVLLQLVWLELEAVCEVATVAVLEE